MSQEETEEEKEKRRQVASVLSTGLHFWYPGYDYIPQSIIERFLEDDSETVRIVSEMMPQGGEGSLTLDLLGDERRTFLEGGEFQLRVCKWRAYAVADAMHKIDPAMAEGEYLKQYLENPLRTIVHGLELLHHDQLNIKNAGVLLGFVMDNFSTTIERIIINGVPTEDSPQGVPDRGLSKVLSQYANFWEYAQRQVLPEGFFGTLVKGEYVKPGTKIREKKKLVKVDDDKEGRHHWEIKTIDPMESATNYRHMGIEHPLYMTEFSRLKSSLSHTYETFVDFLEFVVNDKEVAHHMAGKITNGLEYVGSLNDKGKTMVIQKSAIALIKSLGAQILGGSEYASQAMDYGLDYIKEVTGEKVSRPTDEKLARLLAK